MELRDAADTIGHMSGLYRANGKENGNYYVSYGLNLGWGGPTGDCIGFWGDLLRDILQI